MALHCHGIQTPPKKIFSPPIILSVGFVFQHRISKKISWVFRDLNWVLRKLLTSQDFKHQNTRKKKEDDKSEIFLDPIWILHRKKKKNQENATTQ